MTETDDALLLRLHDGSDMPLAPAWQDIVPFQIGDAEISIYIKEIESKSELDGFRRLTKYHYRGAKAAGRTVPLIATVSEEDMPEVVGFIELSTSFLVNSARQRILDASFSDTELGVGWARWDGHTARKWINCIARISRCVVFPEFRGLGLSSLLVNSAVRYAQQRWHVGGIRPVFMEITADMLRYWPFVKKAGFVYVGDTEGNGHRAARDMRYLVRKAAATSSQRIEGMPRGGGGILSLQRARAKHLKQVIERTGLSFEGVIDHLRTSPDRLSDDEWLQLHTLYRRPKPTYLRGLTTASQKFVLRRAALLRRKQRPLNSSDVTVRKASEPLLDIKGLSIIAHTKPVSSTRSRRLQEAFGIVSSEIEVPVIEQLDFSIRRKEIILVIGPSGSGKSLLLMAIRGLAGERSVLPTASELEIAGQINGKEPSIGYLRECHPDVAPIDTLDSLSLEAALQLMAVAGLAEPQVLIRPSRTLSVGQRYRLSLALGLAMDRDIIMVDDFCEPLDRYTAVAIARQLRRAIDTADKAAIVATSRPDLLLSSLSPDRILKLSSDGEFVWSVGSRGGI